MNNRIAEAVSSLVALLSDFSDNKLKQIGLFSALLEHAGVTRQFELLADLAFHGNYTCRLLKSIEQHGEDAEHRAGLEKEFSNAVQVFHENVSTLCAGLEPDLSATFQNEVLAVSQEALSRLVGLANDFYWLKEWERTMNEQDQGT